MIINAKPLFYGSIIPLPPCVMILPLFDIKSAAAQNALANILESLLLLVGNALQDTYSSL
jgi:hypothetical protein